MSTTTYVIVPAPGHYGDSDRVYSAHSSAASARRALRKAGHRFVCRESYLRRGVLGVAATLSVPDTQRDLRAKERKARASNAAREARGEPTSWTYVLGGNVRVDVRSAVRDYVERGGSPPSVQSLVRGHWKRQPHGPELSLRKWIHVEPYWRGPEDAPIVAARRTL